MRTNSLLCTLAPGAGIMLTACSGPQSSLDASSPQAGEISTLFWCFIAILALVYCATMVALALALFRRRKDTAIKPDLTRAVTAAVVITGFIILVLTGLSYRAQGYLYAVSGAPDVTVKITGYQWWWDVRYEDTQPSRIFSTANELHLPVGRSVEIALTTGDVIHSFWVPGLFGKMDLVNGVTNKIRFTPSKVGRLRGQCAEFCGFQHANMALTVIVEPPEVFEKWRTRQEGPAGPTASAEGEKLFMSKPCASCHAVRGTRAAGRVAPDLTHLASRSHLAAGTLPNTRGALAAWIVDPQTLKPGSKMPAVEISAKEIHPLLDYLEGLK
jgi:cytochrome c oxidase subunit 2